jgi:adenylyltransferase/sulfurtransferase
VIGLIEATEAIKFLLGWGHSLVGRLLTYDAVTMKFREMPLSRNPKCPLTGANPTIKDLEIHRELAAAGGACAVRPS